ncbi:MAG: AraC family transcriptional regulator [Oculatellaceae cyanobacterium bins.114]|nr:AraC family transcriptional regulator [Oculatellaceae cyanobacterium bins.114]
MQKQQEQVKFWRWQSSSSDGLPQSHDVELLHARYITHSFSRHTHDTFAIGVIQQGAEEFAYRGETHVAIAGSIALINPGEVHTGHAATDLGWTYRMLYPDVRLLQHAASQLSDHDVSIPYFPNPVVQDEYLTGLILRLHVALEQQAPQLEQDSRLLWTFSQLVLRHGGDRSNIKAIDSESRAIQTVRHYLEAHYAENVSLETLAAIANLSPFHLLRTFRKQVGLPPHEYLNHIRFQQAKKFLAQGRPISDVAHITGFADQSHLTRQFKRMIGVTPGQYRSL